MFYVKNLTSFAGWGKSSLQKRHLCWCLKDEEELVSCLAAEETAVQRPWGRNVPCPLKDLKKASVYISGRRQEHNNPGRKQPEWPWRHRKRPNCTDFMSCKDFLLHPRSKGHFFPFGWQCGVGVWHQIIWLGLNRFSAFWLRSSVNYMTGFEIFQRSVCFGNRLEVGRNGSKATPSGDLSRISYLQKNCRGFFCFLKRKQKKM